MLYAKIIQDMHDKAKTSLKSMCGLTENFTVKFDVQ